MIYTNIQNVTQMSVGFLLVFTAQNTCSNFASKLFEEDGYEDDGYYSVGVVYLAFALTSLFSKAIMKKLRQVSVAMSVGALYHTFWILSFYMVTYGFENQDRDLPKILQKSVISILIYVSSVITGIGSGLLWVSQGKFLAECACDQNKGFFNSYF